MKRNHILPVILLSSCLALSACTGNRTANTVVGGAAGAGTGALAGSAIGGTTGAVIGGVAGGLTGAYVGNKYGK